MRIQDMPNEIFQLWYWRGTKMGDKNKHDESIENNRPMSFSFHWDDSPEGDAAWRDVHEDSSYHALETFHGIKVQQQTWREHDVNGVYSLSDHEIYYVKTVDGHCHLIETDLHCNIEQGKIKVFFAMENRLNFKCYPVGKEFEIISWTQASLEDKTWLRKCKAQDQTLDHPIVGRFRAEAYEDKVGVKSDANPKFKVGDRVRTIANYNPVKIGETGTVRSIEFSTSIGVEFDNYHTRKHDLNKLCKQGYGWCLGPEQLEVISSKVEEPKPKFKVGNYVKVVADGWGHLPEDIGRITKIIAVKENGKDTNYKIYPPLNSNCSDSISGTNHQYSYELSTRKAFEQDQIEHCGFKVGDRVEYIHEDHGVYGGSKYDLNGNTIGTVKDIMYSEAFDKVKLYVEFSRSIDRWACAPEELKKKEIEIHDGSTIPVNHTTAVRGSHKLTGKDAWAEKMAKIATMEYPWDELVVPKDGWLHIEPAKDDTEFKLQTHKKLDIF